MLATRDYTITRGESWKRLVMLKDRRTHRKRVPTEVVAAVRIGDDDFVLPAEVNWEGGVELTLTAANTLWLEDGVYEWDMVATVSPSPLFTSSPLVEKWVVQGTLTVETLDTITQPSAYLEPNEPLLPYIAGEPGGDGFVDLDGGTP